MVALVALVAPFACAPRCSALPGATLALSAPLAPLRGHLTLNTRRPVRTHPMYAASALAFLGTACVQFSPGPIAWQPHVGAAGGIVAR